MRKRMLALLLVCLIAPVKAGVSDLAVSRTELDVPRQMNLQGFLTDNQGNPVSGARPVTFRIYSGSALKWEETQTCTVVAGLFHVLLGRVVPLPDSVFLPGSVRELELVLDGQPLAPRVALTSVGFAFRAGAVSRPFSPPVASSEIEDGAVTMSKINDAGAQTGYVIKWNGYEWQPAPDVAGGPPSGSAGGDLSGSYPNPTVARLRGREISTTTPTDRALLSYDGLRWVPLKPGGDVDGEISALKVTGLQGRAVYNTTPYTGEVLTWYSGRWEPRPLGGDVSGYAYDLRVTGLQGRPVSSTSPSSGHVLTWYGSQWTPRPLPNQDQFGSVRLEDGRAMVTLNEDIRQRARAGYYVFVQQTKGEPVPVVVHKHEGWFELIGPVGTDAEFDFRVCAAE